MGSGLTIAIISSILKTPFLLALVNIFKKAVFDVELLMTPKRQFN